MKVCGGVETASETSSVAVTDTSTDNPAVAPVAPRRGHPGWWTPDAECLLLCMACVFVNGVDQDV